MNKVTWLRTFIFVYPFFEARLWAQAGIDKPKRQELSAFEIMERVYDQLRYLEGVNKIQLTITTKKGSSVIYKGILYVKGDAALYHFDSLSRGRVLKVLLNNQGANIYAYSIHEKKLFHKKALDRFEPVLDSGFFYIDLANSPFLEYYTPKISGTEKRVGGRDWVKVENIPLDPGNYSRLVVLVDPFEDYTLRRIDYFDTAGVLMKSLEVQWQSLPIKEADGRQLVVQRLARWDMMDMTRGSVSTLEFFSNDKSARLDSSLFRRENLEK
ncbi:MAG: outer membrane lipoprotein-sorting protein [Leptospiraceae bacterium]|nr:outer membrane lipoprotein-sorting protein [Leptospiraceae bacterium]MDW8305450.1 outer membrane lipoprotein-sorting protein [Leptospiraceae bacterium]